ncbi:MAG TPA: PA0069 family radical SAM protein [Thermodesulfobacteriota bacterium]|nr:PA0069 family radical SAM protein [Thermodesulfobacteriota bacterium]
MSALTPGIKGRGSAENPANRFEKIEFEPTEEEISEGISPETVFYKDTSRSIITYNDSPDVGFNAGINPYRGCEHGCIYCYARPSHEFLGLSLGLDFETRIFVKEDAAALLRKELSSPKYVPDTIALSGNTDCYQPAERRFRLTRACLEVLSEFKNPAGIVTKNHLVTRDIDIFKNLAEWDGIMVAVSITTLDPALRMKMEPRTSEPRLRLRAIEELSRNGIPVIVMVAPVIPGLTDHEIPHIIKSAADAGARSAGFIMLRLPYGVSDLFTAWLERNFPDRKEKVLNRIRSVRGGKLNSSEFHDRMRGKGIYAEQARDLFDVACRKAGFDGNKFELSTAHFRRPGGRQLDLF